MERSTKRRNSLREEYYNRRDGRWEREFGVRGESWPIIEHWASERDFTLVAIKGKRRLYQKGERYPFFVTLLDISHEERRVYISSWISVGWAARLLSLLFYRKELHLKSGGFVGIVRRRRACHAMNQLLLRLKQPPIQGTSRFHWADLDFSTLLLMAAFAVPLSYFVTDSGISMEMQPGLSRNLLESASKPAGILATVALLLVITHHWIFVRKISQIWMRWASFSVLSLCFGIASLLTLSYARSEMTEDKVLYHCVQRFNSHHCEKLLDAIKPAERDRMLNKLQTLADELVTRSNRQNGR
jgi:hypothetical protein